MSIKHEKCGCGKPATIRIERKEFIIYKCDDCRKSYCPKCSRMLCSVWNDEKKRFEMECLVCGKL